MAFAACSSNTTGRNPATTGSEEHCFALETMSEDGQGWVLDELGQKLVGLKHRTPRVACRTTQLLSYRGDMSEGDKSMRCNRLDLDLGWEATTPAAEGKIFTGQAKVTMCNKDNHDVVDVAVSVDPACVAALPVGEREREREKMVADVVYAVESLDTAIMEQLNDFLWSMEQHNARSPQAQEEDTVAEGAEGADWGRA
ncbi:hypothetical protein VOLCADRAFT_94184 [Volvox carteri f. nagariensis]|uniref:Activator of Hsp90 ATPase N-terminal domain-containing protein n=1 Tax=Volvox carteri f. nagariensis TaxID=3068 RepID=D8U4C9_VOLCA|nr:uncharacterized protein VOLCADRAFT_94184 [Volvox carteri f. nagariensis]EFJ45479.1 hypothetical protein VOLCADRAFT_94184 [Volvox carteri f. nagariensis]|eukprot:XP_002953506.1 hypothetical protein VOLCADRAFT_94184 [Volvox carteri f. nagariensis]